VTFRLAVVDRTRALVAPAWAVARSLDPIPELVEVPTAEFERTVVDADLLLLGRSELTATGLRRVLRWTNAHPMSPVIAYVGPDGPTDVVLKEHGITTSWRGEISEDRLAPILHRVLAELAEAELAALEPEPEPEPEPDPEPEPGFVVAISSATGGCGKTFFATNLAAHVAASGKRVLLIDLDLQFGEVDAALQARPAHSIYDGLYDAYGRALPEEALEQHLQELAHPTEFGFDLLAAPRDPALADYVTAEDSERLVLVGTRHYDVVVLDTPPALNDVVLAALDLSDLVVVLTTLDVPSLRNLRSFLDVMTELQITGDRLTLLLNKVESDIGIDVGQAQEAFQGRFAATLPADKAASRSINTANVVLRSEPRSPLAKAVVAAIHTIMPPELLPRPQAPDPTSAAAPRRRLFSFRSRTAPGGTL
jgi:MinD-like ATPase involved in chromosome partitioning or flagellar assembly